MHKFSINRIYPSLLIPAVLIVILSLSSFYSIDFQIFRQQLLFLIFSLAGFLIFLNIDYKILGYYSNYLYVAMIIALLLLFFIGVEARGAIRWFDFFGLRLQFSEIIKPFYIIFLAAYLARDEGRNLSKFLKAIFFMLPIFFLILKQPDLGNALVYFFTTILMLVSFGFPMSYFLGVLMFTILPMPIIYASLHDYQKERILTFFDPARDPLGSSYNAVQSLISIGSGGFFGKGFGEATQSILKFLPERHTDFIFATVSETLGFVGALFLILLYVFLLSKIHKTASATEDEFLRLVLLGFFYLFLIHAFLNIGMNLGLVPIVGITLPFASYGGSSLLTCFIILGIISSIKFDLRKRRTLEIK